MTQANAEVSTGAVLTATDYRNIAHRSATARSYAVGVRVYEDWCRERGAVPFPVATETLCDFLVHLAQTRKIATVESRLSAIRSAARARGQHIDMRAPALWNLLRGIRRVHAAPQRQAAALMLEDVRALVGACENDLRGKRDRAVILIGFAGAFRRSEIANMNVGNLAWDQEGVTVHLPRTKESDGADIFIPNGENPETCPALALRSWLLAADIKSGPVFRRVPGGQSVSAGKLNDRTICLIVQKRAAQAGLEGTKENPISGHSLRAGFITSAYKSGATDVEIMHHVRHRTPETMRGYVRREQLGNKHVAAKVGL